jgi:penicillin amidase
MDLARRRAAGELAELVGPRAVRLDREIRVHRFRDEARRALALLGPADRVIYDAYAAGVNTGLQALAARPFEYLILRQNPRPWQTEDTLLVVLSMFITLQETDGAYEATLATMHDVLPSSMFDFLAPRGTEWDAPLVGGAFTMPPIPGPDVYNLRKRRADKPTIVRPPRPRDLASNSSDCRLPTADCLLTARALTGLSSAAREAIGSNNWAIAGRLTSDGGALVANDMHLSIRVPNTWYRAVFEWPDTAKPVGAVPHDGRHAPRSARGCHGQQLIYRLGVHQHVRRLERHRSH